ncbi:TonB-dependent receptor plug domain-containing protein [Allomuricauda sp. d1]|uniref:TonB-dependent receptor n=1 Tax=Allomuricauda sp. d1 TaxID=3136725 RepID=UPI0031E3C67B
MKNLLFCSLIVGLAITLPIRTQEKNSILRKLSDGLRAYEQIWTPEKVYVHTDKNHYQPRETIWAKAYLVDGITHKKSQNSNVLYLELIEENGYVLFKKKIFVGKLGAPISFEIHKNTPNGIYRLRSYTKYMLNEFEPFYFEKEIYIGNVAIFNKNDFDNSSFSKLAHKTNGHDVKLSFYPEGGQLVYGITSAMVIKSTNYFGEPVEVKGEIVNGFDEVVAHFKTGGYGLTKCTFKPVKGNIYVARIQQGSVEKEYALPEISDSGYTLSIAKSGQDLIIKAETAGFDSLEGTLLVGHLRGERFLWFKGTKAHGSKYNVKISSKQLNDGIAHFTLLTKDGKPVSERLVYIENSVDDVPISLTTRKDSLNNEMTLFFRHTGTKDRAVNGNFSVSIIKEGSESFEAESDTDIKNWLMLESDLGNIPLASKIFDESNPIKRRNILDALMISTRWKRFAWKDIIQEKSIDEYIAPEKGIIISGTTTSLKNGKPIPAMVSLDILGQDIYQAKKQTNTQGKFNFGPFDFTDSIPVALKASKLNSRSKFESQKIAINLDDQAEFILPEKYIRSKSRESTNDDKGKYKENDTSVAEVGSYSFRDYDFETGKDITRLKEVVVTEKKKTKEELIIEQIKEITLYNRPTYRVFTDSLPKTGIRNIVEMFRTLPGVQVKGPEGGETVRIRYGMNSILLPTEPIYLVDGVQVSLDAIKTMNSFEVMFIDVLKGADASVYGVRGANGAIAVYTRRGVGLNYAGGVKDAGFDNRASPNILTFTKRGFDKARLFKGMECDMPVSRNVRTLYEKTMFWEPDLNSIGSGHKTLSFCYDDAIIGKYKVRVEGLSEDGQIICEDFEINLN